MLRVRVLGTPVLETDGPPPGRAACQRKSLALLALLARAGTAGASRDKLLAYLWPEAEADRAAHRLTQLIYAIRRSLGAESLFLGTAELRLNPAVVSSDLAEFLEASERGDAEAAVMAYHGPFLDGFFVDDAPEFERWAETERADCERRFRAALESLALAAGRRGEPGVAAGWWRRLAQLDPLNARIAVAYVEAAAAAGDRAGALQFAREHERQVRDELGAQPEPAMLAAVERIRLPAAPPGPSVAVLPFVNMSPEPENEYFSDGMTEELTTALNRVPGLRVASRTSAFTFKGRTVDAREIGERLGVGALVEGSVRKVGDRIRVTAQLVDAASGYHRWSQAYERKLENIFALQDELARAIVSALPLGQQAAGHHVIRPHTPVLEAYTCYLRGRFHSLKRTLEGLSLGIDHLQQAVALDPSYALAYAGLAECWGLRGFEEFGDLPARTAMPAAAAAAERALELDDHLAEGYQWRAVTDFLYRWNWEDAEANFLRAIELRPEYSFAHAWYALFLTTRTRHEEAATRMLHAVELDPLALTLQSALGQVLFFAGRYDEALACYVPVLELEPSNRRVLVWRARTLVTSGRYAEALAAIEGSIALVGRHSLLLEQLGRLYALLGRREEAERVLAELRGRAASEPFSSAPQGSILAALGAIYEWRANLDHLIEIRSSRLPFILVEPSIHSLRQEPWFEGVLQHAGLAG